MVTTDSSGHREVISDQTNYLVFFLAKNENKCQLANCDTCEFFTLFSKFLSTSTWVSFEEILFTEVLTQQVELWTW